MSSFLAWMAVGLGAATVFASFFEWALHRYVMHRPLLGLIYPFERHALVHHRIFRADETYHLQRDEDRATIPMAWWNGPLLVALCQVPFLAAAWGLGQWGIVIGSLLACSAYYGAYEYLHWCMHLPRQRRVERSGVFRRLNGHHLLHHRYVRTNFNVVLPLADLCLGTLLLRSRIRFRQAVGPTVPDVQPKPTETVAA